MKADSAVASSRARVIMIDNKDSFTYNLVDELRSTGVDLTVYRNTVKPSVITNAIFSEETPAILLLSPGPGAPSSAGCMPAVLQQIAGKAPVLGICLGHQAIVEHYGGSVGRAPAAMHGKASLMTHNGHEIFAGIPNPASIARYHSLVATNVPDCLQVIANIDGLPMAILHEADSMLGLQFHPESILTSRGSQQLMQALKFLQSCSQRNLSANPVSCTSTNDSVTLGK